MKGTQKIKNLHFATATVLPGSTLSHIIHLYYIINTYKYIEGLSILCLFHDACT